MTFSNLEPRSSNPHLLITGASSGIGAALALHYAQAGTRLSLHGRSVERLRTVAREAAQRGAVVSLSTGDVTDAAAMAAWIEAADKLQPLDLVIANAGISGGTSGAADDAQQADKIFAVNLHGVFNTIRPAVACMLKRGQGQIAIMSSLAGFRGFAGSGAYCASKAAARVYGESPRRSRAARDQGQRHLPRLDQNADDGGEWFSDAVSDGCGAGGADHSPGT